MHARSFRSSTRSGGAWTFSGNTRGGTGVSLRFTSAQGDVIESTVVIPFAGENDINIDLGVQFTDQAPSNAGSCEFVPPAVIYAEEFGGIDQMRWMISESSGIAPYHAAEKGFVQDTWGRFEGNMFPGARKAELAFIELWQTNPQRPLPFQFGYPDKNEHDHMLVTRKP